LIPARNEEASLGLVISGVRKAAPKSKIVVVNSASTDNTKGLAEKLGATVVDQSSAGYARALRAGYRYLAENDFTQVVQIDADGQHPTEDIPRIFEALNQANWVVGSRADTPSTGGLNRRIGNACLSFLVQLATKKKIKDVTSGYWGLDRKTISLFAESFPEKTADANIRIIGVKAGLAIREIPVKMNERQSGRSMHGGAAGVKNFLQSIVAVGGAWAKPNDPERFTSEKPSVAEAP